MSRLNHHGAEDFYDILEIEDAEHATEHDIRRNYKRLSLQTHPDKNLNDPNATARFQQIKQAYDTLIDESRRRMYNISRKKAKTEQRTARSSSQDSLEKANPKTWYDKFFTKNQASRHFGYSRDSYVGRNQRVTHRDRSPQEWNHEGDKLRVKDSDMGESTRRVQEETNEMFARGKAEAKLRAEEEDLRAKKNMEEHAEASNQRDRKTTLDD
ncbi:DnaJ domain-containing protein [Xylariaceae sp. FL1019]|nr:DnaJ domain-containing protein [Xylariaceae sp. FL1019]